MDIFNKKKLKQVNAALMATKASLETMTARYDELERGTFNFMDELEEFLKSIYLNKRIIHKECEDEIRIDDIKVNGGEITFIQHGIKTIPTIELHATLYDLTQQTNIIILNSKTRKKK